VRGGFAAALAVSAALACAGSSPDTAVTPRTAQLPRIMSTDTLAAWLERQPVSLIDVRTEVATYLKDHLPGAVYLHTETLRASRGGMPTQLLDGAAYAGLFGRLGISFERPVVIYSAGETHNIDATFLAWLLAGFGHPRVYVLDGGYFKWLLEHRSVVQRYPDVTPTVFPSAAFRREEASLEDAERAMRTGDALLVDARPPDQYAGEAGAQMRHGHIPGAISHYWQGDLMQAGFGHVWKPVAQLRKEYAAQGITPERNIIAYCNSATEASHVHFTLRYLLGYPRVRIYVGSWTEWASRDELPVATGPNPR
jgi:thiosulfate/3-mercaptopyruvate sulfurtransferase